MMATLLTALLVDGTRRDFSRWDEAIRWLDNECPDMGYYGFIPAPAAVEADNPDEAMRIRMRRFIEDCRRTKGDEPFSVGLLAELMCSGGAAGNG